MAKKTRRSDQRKDHVFKTVDTLCETGWTEQKKDLPPRINVRYLYQPGGLEESGRRATEPIWSMWVFNIEKVVTKPEDPILYYPYDGPKRGFVRGELMVVPPGTQLPTANVNL